MDLELDLSEFCYFNKDCPNFSKSALMHSRALDSFQAWYNFVKPHKSLLLMVNCGKKRWLQRTPAMAQKLTDHIWTLKKLLTFRVPVK